MADRNAKFRLGAFVAAALTTLAGLIVLFGGAPRLFATRASYTITFAEAPNVAPGTPVRKSGVRIGEVTAVELDPDTGQVNVRLQVEPKYLPRTTDEPTVFRGLLSGDTSVDFVPKVGPDGQPIPPGSEPYPPGTVIPGVTPINPGQFVRQATGVFPTAQESMAQIVASAQRLEMAVPRVERAFDEIAGLARSGREFMPELRRTTDELRKAFAFQDDLPNNPDDPVDPDRPGLRTALGEIREFTRTLRPLVEDLRRIIRANENDVSRTIEASRSVAESVDDLLKAENRQAVEATLKNLQASSEELNKTLRLATIFFDQGNRTLGDVGARVAQTEATFRNLELATRPLAENSEQIVRNVTVAADQLAKTLMEVRETLRALNRGDGTLYKVISDPTLFNNLNDAAVSLTRTLMRAERIAQDLQVFADKIARRPEVIGIGGAVRPSVGLKESPTAPLPTAPLPPVAPITGQPAPSYRPPIASDMP
jgi:phospholipid/cholesterol/gamma-HCH transport system substrate-binding protein